MSHIPSELKYATSHEWIRVEANGEAVVGITEHAQELLGDMVFVELPIVGKQVSAGDDCAVAESVKAVYDARAAARGLKMVYEPKYLRFFQARFEPLAGGTTRPPD